MASGSGYLRTSYQADLAIYDTAFRRFALGLLVILLLLFPLVGSNYHIFLVNLVAIAIIGALALNLLTGVAGQLSLGHAGFLAAGGFTTAILVQQAHIPNFLLALLASGAAGAVLGVVVGLPSLRIKGVYLAIGTLAMHQLVVYGAGEYQHNYGYSTGVIIPDPSIGPLVLNDDRDWFYFLLVVVGLAVVLCTNLMRTKPGRAWMALRDREIAASILGVNLTYYNLLAFVVSSALAAIAGSLDAYYASFVSVEKYTFFLTIQYIAMIIIGGMGSILGSIYGAFFVVLLPYVINGAFAHLEVPQRLETYVFAVQYGAFGLFMGLFLILEPMGLVGIWLRLRSFFELWPFKFKQLARTS